MWVASVTRAKQFSKIQMHIDFKFLPMSTTLIIYLNCASIPVGFGIDLNQVSSFFPNPLTAINQAHFELCCGYHISFNIQPVVSSQLCAFLRVVPLQIFITTHIKRNLILRRSMVTVGQPMLKRLKRLLYHLRVENAQY